MIPIASLPAVRNLLAVAFALALLAASFVPAPSGADAPDGYWEFLGEDGAIWVPAEPPSVTALPPADLGAYHNYDEAVAVYEQLAATRPDLFTLTPIGTSVDGRVIWMMRVTGPGDATERARVLFDGAHHGNEVIGSELLVRFLKQVHAEYDTDPAMQQILAEVVVDVVPMVNVDSIVRIPQCSHYAMCRKNSNGVDLNRNYPDNWGGAGSSGSPGADTYRGPAPLSEPESQAIAAILDAGDYALHASVHSGIELILWPFGWTTARPPDHAVYEELGAELTALTNVPHGQISHALYLASGTTVDQAYGSAAGWRPISFTPEVHGGPGNAFDWWLYFNPPETETAVSAKVGQWLPFLWHLVHEAPLFAPPPIEVASEFALGPALGFLPVAIAAPERRPFVGASVAFHPGAAPVHVDSANPFALPPGGAASGFELVAYGGGVFTGEVVLDAAQAGILRRAVTLDLLQVELGLSLALDEMGTPHVNTATASIEAGPFSAVSGELAFQILGDGRSFTGIPFSAAPGAPATVAVQFGAYGLADGAHRVVATATFTAMLDDAPRPGIARLDAPFTVVRPQVEVTKVFPAASPLLEEFLVRSVYRNTGSMPAETLTLTEVVPAGYVYTGPQTPLSTPPPDSVLPQSDGSLRLSWHVGGLDPGEDFRLAYTLLPVLPGTAVLGSSWRYLGDYGDATAGYGDAVAPTHQTS